MKLKDILGHLETLAPLRWAESWDNVGLLVGDPAMDVTRVLVTVDYTADVAREAREAGADLVVAYHPPMFAAVKRVPHEALWADAVRRGVALYSMHTALDVAPGGTNDVLLDACGAGAEGRRPIRPRAVEPGVGIGRIGTVEGDAPRAAVVARLKAALGLDVVMVAGDATAPARIVATAAGAGGELLGDALEAGIDLFVTGELRHHDALTAARRGACVVATLHSNSERRAVGLFAQRLADRVGSLPVHASVADADPFRFA